MRIAIGSDHAGFRLKEHLIDVLKDGGHDVDRPRHRLRRTGRLPADLRRRRPRGRRGPRRAGHRARRQRSGRADLGQQGARRARRAVQRPLHRRVLAPAQRRQRAVASGRASWARAWPTRSCGCGSPPSSKAGATSAASTRSTAIENAVSDERTPADAPHAARGGRSRVADIIRRETERQNTTIQLIASENFTSPAVLAAQGSVLTNKYSEGYPAKRYYGGNRVVDEAEELARDRLCELFGAEHANVQPHSGANANMAAYFACSSRATRSWACASTRVATSPTGRRSTSAASSSTSSSYGVDRETRAHRLRRDSRHRAGRAPEADRRGRHRVPAHHRLRGVPQHRRRVRCAAHGRRRAHRRPDRGRRAPVAACRTPTIVTLTTHKTLRGPRAGAIMCREQYASAIDKRGVPGAAGRSARARRRGQGGRLQGGDAARVPDVRRAGGRERRCARRCARGRGLPHRVGRYRQPPDAGRPPPLRSHRQGGAGRARPGRDHLQQEHDPLRSREAASSRAGSASAPPR